jgi:hypothetical protein
VGTCRAGGFGLNGFFGAGGPRAWLGDFIEVDRFAMGWKARFALVRVRRWCLDRTMAVAVKSPASKRVRQRYRATASSQAGRVEEGSLLVEIGALRGQVEKISGRLLELEALQMVRRRDATRKDWSPERGVKWEEVRAKGRAIMAKHGLLVVSSKIPAPIQGAW